MGTHLELQAAEAAISHPTELHDDWYLAINVSPDTLVSPDCLNMLARADSDRIVVEVTEHTAVDDDHELQDARADLEWMGVRLAIDDVGTGYSGLSHILRLHPDMPNIDGALIEGIDRSPSQQAMVSALQTYAARIDTRLTAARIENGAEHDALRILGVGDGQGYHFARSSPLDEML